MNTKSQALLIYLSVLGLIVMAMVAISPMIALGYNQIAFTVVPALQAVNVFVFVH